MSRKVAHEPRTVHFAGMNSVLQFLALACHALAVLAVSTGIAWLAREVWRTSRTLGLIMAAGLLLRLALGLAFFWIAEHDLPVLQSLRTPEGIWTFALDSAAYLHHSTIMAEEGYFAIPAGPSPDYVVWLTAWMRLVGAGAAAAPFLNLTLFAILCWLIVTIAAPSGRDRDDLPQLVTVGSFAFSPALLFHGSQALKDDLCAGLIAVTCVGALHLFSHQQEAHGSRRQTIGLLTLLVAGYLLAGLRNYAGGLVGCATVTAAMLPGAYGSSTRRALVRWGGATLIVVIGMGTSLWLGVAGDTVAARAESGRQLAMTLGAKALRLPDTLRHRFHLTGGKTNLAEGPVPAPGAPVAVLTWPERRRALLTGLGAIFVPMSVLQATGAVHIDIGAGLRVATDIDTLFLDASIVAALVLLARRRPAARRHLRYVCFALTLCILTTVFMAYIVTNFGTLFRLRVMLAVPIWMLGLAIARGPLPEVRRVRYAEFTNLLERT